MRSWVCSRPRRTSRNCWASTHSAAKAYTYSRRTTMPPEPEATSLTSLGIDPAALRGNQDLIAFLRLIMEEQAGKRSSRAGIFGDVLKSQGDRAALKADSYVDGAKYDAGFEPGGLMDAMALITKA